MAPRPFGSVRPSGRHTFRALWWDAQAKKQRAAPVRFATKKEGYAWLARKKVELDRAGGRTFNTGAISIGAYLPTWLDSLTVKDNTRYGYVKSMGKHVLPVFVDHRLDRATPDEIKAWHRDLCPNDPSARALAYRLLHAMFDLAVRQRLIEINPCEDPNAGKKPPVQKVIEPLSEPEFVDLCTVVTDEEAALMAADPKVKMRGVHWTDAYYLIPYISVLCGLRRSELMESRRKDYRFTVDSNGRRVGRLQVERQVVFIKGGGGGWTTRAPKNGKVRSVVIPPQIHSMVKAHLDAYCPDDDSLLFTGNAAGGHMSYVQFNKLLQQAKRAAGIDRPFTPHDMRHTAGTWAARTGAGIKELMAFLGHSTPQMAMVYQHLAKDADIKLANSMGNLLENEQARRAGGLTVAA